MRQIKHFLFTIFLVAGTVSFVQVAGGYLATHLSALDNNYLSNVEEKVVKQMVLQLEPEEYYTIQIGLSDDLIHVQNKINTLAQAGYRVFVSSEPPYQLLIGCVSIPPSLDKLPEEIVTISEDLFVKKMILNDVQFQFPELMSEDLQEVPVLLASVDILLKHSLQMFQDYHYEACSEENWNGMINQVQAEIEQIQSSADRILLYSEDEVLARDLLNFTAVVESYNASLSLIKNQKDTRAVLLAQSCLLELIAHYHAFIESSSM